MFWFSWKCNFKENWAHEYCIWFNGEPSSQTLAFKALTFYPTCHYECIFYSIIVSWWRHEIVSVPGVDFIMGTSHGDDNMVCGIFLQHKRKESDERWKISERNRRRSDGRSREEASPFSGAYAFSLYRRCWRVFLTALLLSSCREEVIVSVDANEAADLLSSGSRYLDVRSIMASF